MPFQLESADLILLGNFNPYIVSPDWLEECKIWNADDVHLALGALGQDGIQFQGEGTKWYVSSKQLRIASLTDDCGDMAAKILERLPHTPLSAVGSNFVFQNEVPSTSQAVFRHIRQSIPETPEPQLLRWGALIHEGDARIELTVLTGEQGTTVAFYHHRQAPTTAEGREAAKHFESDKQKSEAMLHELLERQGASI